MAAGSRTTERASRGVKRRLSLWIAERAVGGGTARRMTAAAALRALGLLLRRHPSVALEMAGAGLWAAGAVCVDDLKNRLATEVRPVSESPRRMRAPRLTSRERRRLRAVLKARRMEEEASPPGA